LLANAQFITQSSTRNELNISYLHDNQLVFSNKDYLQEKGEPTAKELWDTCLWIKDRRIMHCCSL